MPNTNPQAATAILANAELTLTAGARGTRNKLMGVLVAGVILATSGLVAPEAHAADPWRSSYSDTSSQRYGRNEALQGQNARLGEVVMVRRVAIDNNKKFNTGTVLGGLLGGAAGQSVKDSRARRASTILGAALGGAIGQQVQQRTSRREGYEIYVRDLSRNGKLFTVVQDADVGIYPGDQVFITGSGSRARIVPVSHEINQRPGGSSQLPASLLDARGQRQSSYESSPSPDPYGGNPYSGNTPTRRYGR